MVHDLSFVSFPAGFKRYEQLVYSQLVRRSALRARHIVTVSEFSKKEIMDHWGIPANRITVTYNGIDEAFQPSSHIPNLFHPCEPRTNQEPRTRNVEPPPSKIQNPKSKIPYILCVGNLHPRKNLVRLLEAFVLLKKEHQIPHKLKIVGQTAWMFDEIFACVRNNNLENQVEFTGYLSQHELVLAYQNAAVAVYPSLYEGFGLPPLEAMACGCPVVCSSAASLPEVCGSAALLVDPLQPTSIARGIMQTLTDTELKEKLIIEGLKQARQFTWENCALNTLTAYRTL
jgi:glycosyltransferase involved in cell wall biosynthesis